MGYFSTEYVILILWIRRNQKLKNNLLHGMIYLLFQMIQLLLLYCTYFTCFFKLPFLVIQRFQELFLLLQE